VTCALWTKWSILLTEMSAKSPVFIIKDSRCYGAGAECSVPFFHSFCFCLSCFNTHHPQSFCATSIKLLCIISLFQLLACAVNSACLALMNSGIAMKFLVAAVSCMIDHEDKTLIDPDSKQLKVRYSFSQCHCIGNTLSLCSIITFPLKLCDLATGTLTEGPGLKLHFVTCYADLYYAFLSPYMHLKMGYGFLLECPF